MIIKVNLFPHTLNSDCFYIKMANMLSHLLCILGFYGLLYLYVQTISTKSILGNIGNYFSNWSFIKAITLAPLYKNQNLAINFLGNVRNLDVSEKKTCLHSGITHLLAISGGQISLVIIPIAYVVCLALYPVITNNFSAIQAQKIINHVKTGVQLLVCIIMSLTFRCTGALVRVIISFITHQIPVLHQFCFGFFYNLSKYISIKMWIKFIIIMAMVRFVGNPFYDLSFLLSYLGCTLVGLLSINNYIGNSLFFKNVLLNYVANIVLTSVFITLILTPIFSGFPLKAAAANIFALPLTNFWITPWSLIALIVPINSELQKIITPCLDGGLSVFLWLADVFSVPSIFDFNYSPSAVMLQPQKYLSFLLILCWTIEDFFAAFKFNSIVRSLNIKSPQI